MIVDLAVTELPTLPSDAVVVVGSGAAGIALAEYLDDAGTPVVLIESGPAAEQPDDHPSHDLNVGVTVGSRYTGLTDGRVRQLGGTTALWHGQCMRLHEIDLRRRDWVPGSGWPLGPRDLQDHYTRAEAWLGVTGLGYGLERWREHRRLTPVGWDTERLLHDFTEYTPQPMIGRTHRASLASRPGIHTLVNATVGRVLVAGDGVSGTVTGVQLFTPDGTSHEIAARRLVLAAGAIENARILQLSDAAQVGLGTGRIHTGRYLQDHPIIRTAEVLAEDHRFLQDRYVALHRGRRRLFPKVRLAPDAQEAAQLVDATAAFVHDHDQPALAAARRLILAARARRAPEALWPDVRTAVRAPAPVVRDAYRRYVRGLATGARPSQVWLELWLEQVPDPDSRVTLGTGTDRFGLPRAQVDWRIGRTEIETSRQLTRWIAADLERLGLARVRELEAMHDDDAWRASVRDAFHPSSTTRMSADPEGGVVDPDLQVHGVPGLYVVGGSVFPVAGYANPTLTIVALALRLGERLGAARSAAG